MPVTIPHTTITFTDEDCKSISKGIHELSVDYRLAYRSAFSIITEYKMVKSNLVRLHVPKFRVMTENGAGTCSMIQFVPSNTYPFSYGVKLDNGMFSHFTEGIAYHSLCEITVL